MHSVNLPAVDKSQTLREAKIHLLLAKKERELYNTKCMVASEEVKISPQFPEVIHTLALTLSSKFTFLIAHNRLGHCIFNAL